ncbi:hypothetical protein GCM10009647_062140 [Streptomyces sanglieri]
MGTCDDMDQLDAIGMFREGIAGMSGQLTETALSGTAAAAMTTTAPLAAPALAFVGHTWAHESISNTLEDANSALRDLTKEYEDPDTRREAVVGKVTKGLSKCIEPAISDTDDLASLARSDPEQFEAIITQLLNNPERREDLEEIEHTLRAIFLGKQPPESAPIGSDATPDELFEELMDIFSVDDRQEAMVLFILYEELIDSFASELEQSGEEDAAEALEQWSDDIRKWAKNVLEEYLECNVKNQDFDILTARDFDEREAFANEKTPISAWVAGYGWPELVATDEDDNPYYFERVLPATHPIAGPSSQDDPLLVNGVVTFLQERGNLVLKGEPGMGKSHICQRVAAEWFNSGYGEVFYRESGGSQSFDKDAELNQAIERSQSVGDGTVLVVVEDASREDARRIFDVIDEFKNRTENVRFLLDSRVSDWDTFVDRSQREYLETRTRTSSSEDDRLTSAGVPEVSTPESSDSFETQLLAETETTPDKQGNPPASSEPQSAEILGTDMPGESAGFEAGPTGTEQPQPAELDSTTNRSNRTIYVHKIPPISKEDCERAIETFNNALEDGWYEGEPADLYDAITDNQSNRGELLVLANELVENSTYTGELPLGRAAEAVHTGTDTKDGFFDYVHGGSESAPLFYKLSVGISMLTAAEVDIQPALLYSLADDRDERSRIKALLSGDQSLPQESEELPVSLNGVFVFPDDTTDEPYTRRHALWGRAFLNDLMDRERDDFWSVDPHLSSTLSHVIARFSDLPHSPDQIQEIDQFLRGRLGRPATPYLDRVKEDPDEMTETLLKRIFSFGVRDPTFFPLFQDIIEQLPESVPQQVVFELRLRRAEMIYQAEVSEEYRPQEGRTASDVLRQIRLEAESLPSPDQERIQALADKKLAADANGPEQTKKYLQRAIDELEGTSLDSLRAQVHEELAKSAYSWPDERQHYKRAIEALKGEDNEEEARVRKSLARSSNWQCDWETTQELYEDAIEAYKRVDEREAVQTQKLLADAADLRSEIDWETTRKLYEDAVVEAEKVSEELAADLQLNLAEGAGLTQGLEWETVRGVYEDAIEAYSGIDDREVVRTQKSLAEAADFKSDVDWETTKELYEDAIAEAEQIDEELAASFRRDLAEATKWNRQIDWETTQDLFEDAIEAYTGIDKRELVRTKKSLAEAASNKTDWKTTRDIYESAIETAEKIDKRTAASLSRQLAEATAYNPVEWEILYNLYDEAIYRYKNIDETKTAVEIYQELANHASGKPTVNWNTTRNLYTKAINASREIDPELTAKVRLEFADAANQAQTVHWGTTKQLYKQAIESHEGISNHQYTFAYRRYVDAAKQTPTVNWETTREIHENALRAVRDFDKKEAADIKRSLGDAAQEAEVVDWKTTQQIYQEAIDVAEKVSREEVASVYQSYARAAHEADEVQWEITKDLYEEILSIYENTDKSQYARVYNTFADNAKREASVDWETTQQIYEEAINAAKEINQERKAEVQLSFAEAAQEADDVEWETARSLYESALKSYKNTNKSQLLWTYESFGRAAEENATVGWEETRQIHERAIDAAEKVNQEKVARAYQSLANAAQESDEVGWKTTKKLYRKALEKSSKISKKEEISMIQSFADASLSSENSSWEFTKSLHEEAIELAKGINKNRLAGARESFANAAQKDNDVGWEVTKNLYKEAISEADNVGGRDLASTVQAFADAAKATDSTDWETTKELYAEAIEMYEGMHEFESAITTRYSLVNAAREENSIEWCNLRTLIENALEATTDHVSSVSSYRSSIAFEFADNIVATAIENDATDTANEWCDQFERGFVQPRKDVSNQRINDIRNQYSALNK